MGGFGLDENYSGSSSYATPSNYAGPSDNAGPSSYVGQSNYAGPSSNAGTSAYNEEDNDPKAIVCCTMRVRTQNQMRLKKRTRCLLIMKMMMR
ncbi:UNVERIFIED_CONTAM: hypothetical protein Sradi_3277500 [Sesamum radiatum]|uniref:Uncharacterized protein n=1 Tax=Sesamum radiatum TaxID=300843 RepID=A0AAW2R0K2_SESRA